MYERILVPLDSSKLADMVLPYAEVLAGVLNSRVTLLYVSESEEEHYLRAHKFYLGKIAELVRSHIKERYPEKKATSIRVKAAVMAGKPAEEIVDYARENNISLVVIAGRGRTGIMRRLMGHVADKVFQATKIPLLIITAKPYPEPSPLQLIDRILLPLDGSKSGEAALPYIIKLAKRLRVDVTMLRVVTPVQQVRTIRGLDYVKFTEQQLESTKASAQQYLESLDKKLAGTKAFLHHEVRIADNPATEIVNLANERNVRLLAIATHRYAGIRRLISGSIAQKILKATNKPVLLVKATG
jgi:nucleotide-binding universal stress UspA family protein